MQQSDEKASSKHPYQVLIDRMGESHFRQRFTLQVNHASRMFGQGRTLMHIENMEWLMVVLYYGLKLTGLYRWGYRNFKDIRIVENTVRLAHLPDVFDGFRILHLSDLHLDLDPGLCDVMIDRVLQVDYDLAVLTGDYRANTSGDFRNLETDFPRLVGALKNTPYGILGNHDFIEFVPPLEDMGLRMLLNETVRLERGGRSIWLSGIDDPHFYETDNLQMARSAVPDGAFSILLSHSPEIYRAAAAIGYDFMLSGHTHAGQICLPGRIPIMTNARCPRRMTYGGWAYGPMRGYTSAGTGSSGVPVRFFCPPEMTVHTLRCMAG